PGSGFRPEPKTSESRVPPGSSRPRSVRPPDGRFLLPPVREALHRMDAKQVWRAALGELQVSLSPANYETWLRDTQLIDVDEQRFRIGVPNGFAKPWLETRDRSLISQTLARIVGYSVQVEFVVGPRAAGDGPDAEAAAEKAAPVGPAVPAPVSQHVRVEPTRVGGEGGATYLNPR